MKPGWENRIDERRYFDEMRARQSQDRMERARQRVDMEMAKLELRLANDRSRYIAVVKESQK